MYGGYGQQQQGWGQQQQGWGQQQQQQPQQQQQQQAAAPAQQAGGQNKDVTLIVTGCTHGTVGGIVRGSFQLCGENHGKPTYKKDGQVNGLDVMSYYWDERDGPGFCGWWFGPKVGGDQVWAYHTDKAAAIPPQTGWKVPYDGPVDATFVIQYKPKGAPAQQQQQPAQQWGQQGMQQQQQPMQQQQQGGWAQQQQQMQQKQAQEQQRLEEQRRQLEALKKKQQDDNVKRAEDMRKQQMMQQQQTLAANKARLEEANAKRLEDQKKKMEEMKEQQQKLIQARAAEQAKKQAEIAAKKYEQQAVLNVRRVLQQFRATPPDKYEEKKKELDEAVEKEIEHLGSQKELITKEIEQVVTTTKARVDQIAEMKRKQEEAKEAENQRKRDLKDKAVALLAELEKLVEKCEKSGKSVAEEAEALTSDKEMRLAEIEAVASAAEEAGKDATETAKACSDFVTKESPQIKNPPVIQGEPPATCAADLAKLVGRMTEAKKVAVVALAKVAQAKATRITKAQAKERYEKSMAPFKKFDADKDNKLSRREVQAFSKGAYGYSLPADALDDIFKVLVKEDAKGVDKADFHRLQCMIGISRENSTDSKKRTEREAREKLIADQKDQMKASFEGAAELIKASVEAVSKAEKTVAPLSASKGSASEMVKQADEADQVIEAAKASLTNAKDAVGKYNADECEKELKAYVSAELNKLKGQLSPIEQRSTKAAATCSKFRAEASKKNQAELEKLRGEGLSMMWHHQGAKKLSQDDLYKVFDNKKKGKVEEGKFVQFFETCKIPEDTERMSEENAERLFKYLDSDDAGHITKEQFLNMIRRFMKVLKASVITGECSTKSKPLRRLNEGEVLECLTGPTPAEEDIPRIKVKAMSDNVEGWVTPVGNRGTIFVEDGGNTFKVVKETILTGSFVIGGDSKTKDRKLKVGEIVEAREWARKEEVSGLMRMKVRVKSDGQIGWATSLGNTGVVFLESL